MHVRLLRKEESFERKILPVANGKYEFRESRYRN